jgi:hypothetical protein
VAGPAPTPSPKATSAGGRADSRERTSGFGAPGRRPPSSTGCDTHGQKREAPGPFSVRASGTIGQEVIDQDGMIIAWTTDEWVALVIRKLLNENEGLLR